MNNFPHHDPLQNIIYLTGWVKEWKIKKNNFVNTIHEHEHLRYYPLIEYINIWRPYYSQHSTYGSINILWKPKKKTFSIYIFRNESLCYRWMLFSQPWTSWFSFVVFITKLEKKPPELIDAWLFFVVYIP